MGLLDSILGAVGQRGTGNPLLDTVLQFVNDPQHGGLAGLVQGFQQKGLGSIVDSWVSTGQNLPISPDQIAHGLGNDKLASLAQSLGISQGDVSSQLSQILPNVVDKLTPGGALPSGDEMGDLLASVKKHLG